MNYKLILIFFFLASCDQNYKKNILIKPFNSKGFAYIYDIKDFNNKTINKKLDNNTLQIAHNKLRPGSLIKLINPKTNDSVILKNSKRIIYPDFYKIVITEPVAKKINLKKNLPLIELIEIKKNKFYVAQKSKIYKEEKKIYSNAPVTSVKIDNISKNQSFNSEVDNENIYILIGEFYSFNTANKLKERITNELSNFDTKKLYIKTKKANKISLLSGPYKSINLVKNDYIELKKFGFEELDISINE
ncbi:hypothetical protein OAA95_00770 [Pelagibacteraceae bacterium]|nr:hypothetical protein [Pelagibacteraceae bacterium]